MSGPTNTEALILAQLGLDEAGIALVVKLADTKLKMGSVFTAYSTALDRIGESLISVGADPKGMSDVAAFTAESAQRVTQFIHTELRQIAEKCIDRVEKNLAADATEAGAQ